MTEFTALCLVGMLGCLAYIILNKLTKQCALSTWDRSTFHA